MRDDLPLAAPGVTAPAGLSRRDAWDTGLRRWDVYNAVILVATVAIVLVVERPRPAAYSVAALAAMAVWYILIGRATLGGSARPRQAMVYLAGLVVLLAAAEAPGDTGTFILLALGPQCFMAVSYRTAVLAVTALNIVPLLGGLIRGESGEPLFAEVASAVLGTAFSIAVGSWVAKIINQSSERADLIEQLEATRAELAAAHREAGVLAERQRISADIHDTIAQGFASIIMLAQAAEAGLRADPDGASRHLSLAIQAARDNLAEARGLVAGLAPAQLDGGSLDDALRRVTAQTAAHTDLAADVAVTGTPRALPTYAEVLMLRVCQEALSNVRKHARASRASVRLAYDADQVRLDVTDDGAGFDPARATGGYGLSGMRARAAQAGAALVVTSAPAAGTTVSVTVPS